jgi:ADP-dependent NAD(P)H-hydrate dehydratase / NAD(P)H-hydrate epimerase
VEEESGLRIGTSQTMNEVDRACVERLKIPMTVLMENAALKVLKSMEFSEHNRYVIVCGSGNNGGDGFALARHLIVAGKSVEVFLISTSNKLSEGCEINYNILKNMGVKIRKVSNLEDVYELREFITCSDLTVDAIFGTGLNKNVEGVYEAAIVVMNENSRRIVSIDIPSGLHSDSGTVLGTSVRAHKTVTFEMYKRGFLNYESGRYIGEVVVEGIGVPDFILEEFHQKEYITEVKDIQKSIKLRDRYNHKGNYGRTLVIAGSRGFAGAAYIAAEAAVKSGSGLVTLGCSEEIQDILSGRLTEAMTVDYNNEEAFERLLKISTGIAFGPGMGNNEKTLRLLTQVIERADCPVVIDADGINVMVGKLDILKRAKSPVIITPHLGEMSRVTGRDIDYIRQNRLDVAKDFAGEQGITVLLKGYQTVITNGRTTYINPTGSSAMASGGMGDCLTGIIAAFAAQGLEPIAAAFCGAYVHGYIGDRLTEGMHSVNASHIIERLPFGIKEILEQ